MIILYDQHDNFSLSLTWSQNYRHIFSVYSHCVVMNYTPHRNKKTKQSADTHLDGADPVFTFTKIKSVLILIK